MHQEGFAHRDIKPHNILLDHDSKPVIMDLGSATIARVQVTSRRQASLLQEEAAIKASAPYRCPELTEVPNEICIDERIDIWSLGCTAYCLAFGNSPFESTREGVLRLAILNGNYKKPTPARTRDCSFSTGFMDLVQTMLAVDPGQRPYARDILLMCQSLR
jgi:serine/threonine kinase 16